jgi:hypothetical protein
MPDVVLFYLTVQRRVIKPYTFARISTTILQHPPSTITQRSTKNSRLSSSKQSFETSLCEKALNRSNNQYKLDYAAHPDTHTRQEETEQETWFTPPFCKNVKTNVRKLKIFYASLTSLSYKLSPLHKIVNRNTIKISYIYM